MGIIDSIKKRTPKTAANKTVSADAEVQETKPKKAAKKAATLTATGKVALHGTAHKVLIAPIVSEKSTIQESAHVYTFLVEKNANKIEIKKAIQEVYGVKPLKVRTILMDGKSARFGRTMGRRNSYKKAIVTTAKDQRLAIHEGV